MRTIFIVVILFLLKAQNALAQVLPADINISIFPTDPKPGQVVTATVESFGMDLTKSNISWQQNGKNVLVGIGKTNLSFTAPDSGKALVISVAASDDTSDANSSITIRPASVDVIWEAIDAYTPPFYKGKALASTGGRLRAVAIASGNAPKTLSYSWKYNDSSIKNQSGTNKNSLSIKTDMLSNRQNFSVQVSGGTFEGNGGTSLSLRNPDIVLYKKSNGFINYANGSIDNMNISESGTTLRVEPFNFSVNKIIDQTLNIVFDIGGQSFSGISQSQELPITRPENGGESIFTVNISSLKERLQNAKHSFTLSF